MPRKRQAQNQIRISITKDARLLQTDGAIKEEISIFYNSLLGTAPRTLLVVNVEMMKRGKVLCREQQRLLIKQVSKDEVQQALLGINDNKALGCDGFNAHFLKKSWIVIGEEVTHVVLQFLKLLRYTVQ